MKLIDKDKLNPPAYDECEIQPYVKLAKDVREADEVKAIPESYIDALIEWIVENNPGKEQSHQAITLVNLKKAYADGWRPWENR